jgi:hypothetical protein
MYFARMRRTKMRGQRTRCATEEPDGDADFAKDDCLIAPVYCVGFFIDLEIMRSAE